jgi:uncharacterized protein with von Willebrand factor type A (vWA) domain
MRDVDIDNDEMFAIKGTRNDRQAFEALVDQMDDLKQLGEKGAKDLPRFTELQNDAFTFFNKAVPVINDDTHEAIAPHAEIIKHMKGMQETEALRNMTVHNTIASAVAVRELNDVVANLPPDVKRKAHKHQCDQNNLQASQDYVDQLRALWKMKKIEQDIAPTEKKKQEAQDAMDKVAEQGHDAADELDEAEASADKSTYKLDTAMNQEESGIRVALRDALAQAQKNVKATQEALGAFGSGVGDDAGLPVQIPEIEAMKMANLVKHDDQLKRIAEIAGRMQRIAEQTRKQKITSIGGGIVGIEMGREINKLTPTELASFADPDTELLMWQRIIEGKAEVWKTESEDKTGLGPIIVMQDGSGSTGGEIFNWESGMALALRQECAKRGQPFFWIHFDTKTLVMKFEGEGQELEAAQWAQTFLGGGTNPTHALNKAIQVLCSDDDFKDADIILFSDGQFHPDHEVCSRFRTALQDNNARCLGIYMGGRTNELADTSFGPICDVAWSFNPCTASGDEEITFLSEIFSETTRS